MAVTGCIGFMWQSFGSRGLEGWPLLEETRCCPMPLNRAIHEGLDPHGRYPMLEQGNSARGKEQQRGDVMY